MTTSADSPAAPAGPPGPTPEDALRSHLFGIRWPLLLQAPREQVASRPIPFDDKTTAAQFTRRVVFGAVKYTVPGGILLALSQLCSVAVPVTAGLVVDRAIARHSLAELLGWTGVLVAVSVAASLCFRFGSRTGFYGMQQVQHRLRMDVTDRLLDPAGMETRRLSGALLATATGDVFRLAATMQLGIYPVGELCAVVACAVALTAVSWPLGLAVLVGAPLMLWIMTAAGRPLQRRSRSQQALVARATGQAGDIIAGYRVIKGLRAERTASDRYRRVSSGALDGALRARNSRALYLGTMNSVSGVFIAGLTVGAAVLALEGQLTVGELISVVGLTQFLLGPLTSLPTMIGAPWATGVASADRVLDLLRTPGSDTGPGVRTAPERDRPLTLTVTGATVSAGAAPDAETDAETEVETDNGSGDGGCGGTPVLTVSSGECVGVRAEGSRAGELVGQLAHGHGVLVDDIPAGDLDILDYRNLVLTAPHTADLFEGTVTDNLAVPGSDSSLVPGALHAAACDDILATLPHGELTMVGDGGLRLSGGQRQRIALARALAADPPVLVLHDPTTAVDPVTEATVAERLRPFRRRRATVVVTASPAMLSACDRVVEL